MINSIYDFQNYRLFLNTWISQQKLKGQKGRLANAMGVSSTLVSLILKGEKQMSLEQASEVADYIGLKEREGDYFFLLVELGRAGTYKLQQKLRKRIREQQEQAKKISRRVKKDRELSEEEKAIFYSSWLYTAICNLVALEEFNDLPAIAQRLNVPTGNVIKAMHFLTEHSLVVQKNSKWTYGTANTHVDSESPFVAKHHQNWRLRGFQEMDRDDDRNLFYTCPMSLSKEAAEQIRRLLPTVIEEVLKIVGPSPSEELYCLNMDWFRY